MEPPHAFSPSSVPCVPSSWSLAANPLQEYVERLDPPFDGCITYLPKKIQYSHLYRGVWPFYFAEKKPNFYLQSWQEDVDRRLKWGINNGIKLGIISEGDNIVCVQGWRGGMGHTNTVRVVPAEENLGLVE